MTRGSRPLATRQQVVHRSFPFEHQGQIPLGDSWLIKKEEQKEDLKYFFNKLATRIRFARMVDKNIYIIQGEISIVVGAIKRNARWSTHTPLDEERDPLLHSFSHLKEVLNNVTGKCV
eukprot:bmy_15418T0